MLPVHLSLTDAPDPVRIAFLVELGEELSKRIIHLEVEIMKAESNDRLNLVDELQAEVDEMIEEHEWIMIELAHVQKFVAVTRSQVDYILQFKEFKEGSATIEIPYGVNPKEIDIISYWRKELKEEFVNIHSLEDEIGGTVYSTMFVETALKLNNSFHLLREDNYYLATEEFHKSMVLLELMRYFQTLVVDSRQQVKYLSEHCHSADKMKIMVRQDISESELAFIRAGHPNLQFLPGHSISVAMLKNPGVQRYLVAIEYIGTRFCGSHQQPHQRTVAGVLQETFEKFVGQRVSIGWSTETHAGVHALSNVCHIDVKRTSKRKPGEVLEPHDPSTVRKAVNHFLRKEGDVRVIDVRCVPYNFHARAKAKERTYYYCLLSGPESLFLPFERDQAWHVPEDLNLQAMQDACEILVGKHDFTSFRSTRCQANSPVMTLDELHVYESTSSPYFPSSLLMETRAAGLRDPFKCLDTDTTYNGSKDIAEVSRSSCQEFGVRRCLIVKARARSFLYHQVRFLVALLKYVGTGHVTLDSVKEILDAKIAVAASAMAPACGLYLGEVTYDQD